jgi:hypothetical protein
MALRASAHLVHLGLVAWIYYASVVLPAQSTLIFFGVGAFWTYLLAIFSNTNHRRQASSEVRDAKKDAISRRRARSQ